MPTSELKELIDQHGGNCKTRTWISNARSFVILVIHLTRRCYSGPTAKTERVD